jgi:glycosyltransferase involved in cell wall biosynthesis
LITADRHLKIAQNVEPKIKVLHIIKSLGRGGAETLLPETLKLHAKDTFEFHYLYFLPWKNQMVEAIEQAGGKVTCLTATNNLQMIRKVSAVIQYIRQHNINIVHAHLPWAGVVARLVHRRIKVPVIYTEHNKQERYHMATRLLNTLTFNWQTSAVAVSADVAVSIKKNINPSVPVIEILNGVNTDFFQRDISAGKQLRGQMGIPHNAVVVGTLAVFRFQKRLTEWLDVFKEASEKHPNLYGLMVGDGPLKDELVQRRKTLGLEDRVIMPGLQTEVKPWYSVMDVFMMTSVFEGLPIALLEAMSMECAIVTTDAGGVKQVIRHGVDGILVNVDQWSGLPMKLDELINDERKRIAFGVAARSRVVEAFSLKRMVGELEEVYLSLT